MKNTYKPIDWPKWKYWLLWSAVFSLALVMAYSSIEFEQFINSEKKSTKEIIVQSIIYFFIFGLIFLFILSWLR